jgi:murein DD-endopeptidase MepM/ murein hydrolase activator NlpD
VTTAKPARSRGSLLRAGLALLAGAVLLATACGGGSDAEEVTPTPTAKPAGQSPAPTGGSLTPAPSATPGDFYYTVQEGDVPGAIAERFGISLDALFEANGLTEESLINPGDELLIVGSSVSPPITSVPTLDPSIVINNPAGHGWLMPVAGACVTPDDNQMPNAPRDYRNGTHEGIDFFTGFACVDVAKETPTLASKAGRVIRVDHVYKPLTQSELDELYDRVAANPNDRAALDRFRGRQVWIDHGNGFVTRYCHLDGIPEELTLGAEVEQGQVVGFIGDSGTPESVTNPGFEIHLHFEVRIGDSFLGDGEPPEIVRALYVDAFFGQ